MIKDNTATGGITMASARYSLTLSPSIKNSKEYLFTRNVKIYDRKNLKISLLSLFLNTIEPVVLKFQNILKIYEIVSAWAGFKERATNSAYVEYPNKVFMPPTNKNFTNLLGSF